VEGGFVDISGAQDGGLLKKILVEGAGEQRPSPGSSVQVHYVGTLHDDGSKFDSSRDRPGNFKFEVGMGQVIKGWDEGILTMKRKEKCILRCRSDYAYGSSGHPPTIPGGATLNFEVELLDWQEKTKPADEMTVQERFAYATKMKEEGTAAFKMQDWATAVNRYADGAEYITFQDSESPAELDEQGKVLAVALLNNCAMARLKVGDQDDAAKFDCTKVLQYDSKNVKAFFRRAQAEIAMGNYKAAAADAAKAVELEPGNREAELLRRKALETEKKKKKAEQQMFSKMLAPAAASGKVLLWFHGLGDTGDGWRGAFSLGRSVEFRHPTAPKQPVSAHGGTPTTSWFDIVALPVVLSEPEGPKGIDESVASIHSMLQELEKEGYSASHIMLGGFSQGGTMALLAGLGYSKKLAGIISISGWCAKRADVSSWISDAGKRTPVLMCCGDGDPVVDISITKKSAEMLQAFLGPSIDVMYPKREMHQPKPEEMARATAFMKSHFNIN